MCYRTHIGEGITYRKKDGFKMRATKEYRLGLTEEAKKIVFKGNLPRYSDFQTMLSILEKSSEVKFSEKNRVITVSI